MWSFDVDVSLLRDGAGGSAVLVCHDVVHRAGLYYVRAGAVACYMLLLLWGEFASSETYQNVHDVLGAVLN